MGSLFSRGGAAEPPPRRSHLIQQTAALVVAYMAAAAIVYSYAHIAGREDWDNGRLPTAASLSSSTTTAAPPSPPPPFFACHFRVVGFGGEASAAALVEGFLEKQRHSDVLKRWSSRGGAAGGGPLLCRGGEAASVVHFATTGDTARAVGVLDARNPTSAVVRLPTTASGDEQGRVTITLMATPSPSATVEDQQQETPGPRCAARRTSSLDASILCAIQPTAPHQKRSLTLEQRGAEAWSRIEVTTPPRRAQSGDAAAMPRSKRDVLSDVAAQHITTAHNVPRLVRDLLVDHLGPSDADDIERTMLSWMPRLGQDYLPTTTLLQLGTRTGDTLRRGDDRTVVLSELEAAAVLRDPGWTNDLMLPPDQLIALHMPLFLPLGVSLLGATRLVVAGWRQLRRGGRRAPQ